MTAMATVAFPYPVDAFTVDDLPEDVRCELVDGALLVVPPAELRHDEVAAALVAVLHAVLPHDLRVMGPRGVHFDRRNYRVPDVVVYRRAARDRNRIDPENAVLVVEVVSPSSVSTDRVAKPAQYAAAGIPHFWQLELDPLVLVTHALGDAYRVTGRYDDEVAVDEPVPLRFRLEELLD